MRRELHTLSFAAGQCSRGLAEADVTEPDLVKDVELVNDLRVASEVAERLLDGHVEHVVDVAALVLDIED